MVKKSLAYGLQNCIGQLLDNGEFDDFTVVVEDKKYRCHRLILRACSRFFAGLLRSDMRENTEGSTELFGMTSDTFDVIMNSVYRGTDGLTQENVVSIWKVVHQLQIDYLVTECEDFVMKTISLDNYLEYYDCANLLQSNKVVKFALNFMVKNFNHFRNTETFLKITADELYMMVKSHNLNAKSEELLIKSILRWVTHLPISSTAALNVLCESSEENQKCSPGINEDVDTNNGGSDGSVGNRSDQLSSHDNEDTTSTGNQQANKIVTETEGHSDNVNSKSDVRLTKERLPLTGGKYIINENRVNDLGKLLSVARVCLLQPEYLQNLIKNPIISSNREASAVLINAYFYQQNCHYNFWPLSAVHRACSDMEHGMVYIDGQTHQCKVYSLHNGSTHVLCALPVKYNFASVTLTLCIWDQMLILGIFSLINIIPKSEILVWEKSAGWKIVVKQMDTRLQRLVSHSQQIYMLTEPEKHYEYRYGKIMFNTIEFCRYVRAPISFKNNILFVSNIKIDTFLVSYNCETTEATFFKQLEDPAKDVISFRCGENSYFLQENGTLHLVNDANDDDDDDDDDSDNDENKHSNAKMQVQTLTKLWYFDWRPCGAIVFKDELVIFGCPTDKFKTWQTSVPGNSDFKTIKMIQIDSYSDFHPMIVPKSWLN